MDEVHMHNMYVVVVQCSAGSLEGGLGLAEAPQRFYSIAADDSLKQNLKAKEQFKKSHGMEMETETTKW